MKILLILSLALLSQAGIEILPYGIVVEWTFPSLDIVHFTLKVPDSIYTAWEWVGFGLKHSDEKDLSMNHSDLFIVIFDGTRVEDHYGIGNRNPPLDTKAGGYNDMTFITEDYSKGIHSFSWLRKLITGDEFDIELKRDSEYIIMWAIGNCMLGGPIMHTPWNRGREYIVFSEDYCDDGSDDWKGDGDGSYIEPENFLMSFI